MAHGILAPTQSPRLEVAERPEELLDMTRAMEEPLADWHISSGQFFSEQLKEMRFERCTFTGCRFAGAELAGASFVDCRFKNCDLSGVRADNVYFCRCDFDGVKALGAVFIDARFAHVTIRQSNFSSANMTGASIEKVQFTGCDLSHSSLSEWRHKQLFLEECVFTKANFFKTSLKGLDFTTSQLEGIVVSDEAAELRGAVVSAVQAADLARLLGLVVR